MRFGRDTTTEGKGTVNKHTGGKSRYSVFNGTFRFWIEPNNFLSVNELRLLSTAGML